MNLSPRVSAWATYSAEDSPAVVPYSHTTASKGSKRSQRHSTNTGILWNLRLKLTQQTAEQVCEFTPTLPTSQLIHSHLAQRHLDHAQRELLQFRQPCVQLDQLHSREAQVQASRILGGLSCPVSLGCSLAGRLAASFNQSLPRLGLGLV